MQLLFKIYLQETSTFFKDDAVESVLFLNSRRNNRFRKIGRKQSELVSWLYDY